jgi:hypothetical protein
LANEGFKAQMESQRKRPPKSFCGAKDSSSDVPFEAGWIRSTILVYNLNNVVQSPVVSAGQRRGSKHRGSLKGTAMAVLKSYIMIQLHVITSKVTSSKLCTTK